MENNSTKICNRIKRTNAVKDLSNIVFSKDVILGELEKANQNHSLKLIEPIGDKSDKALDEVISKAMVKVKEYFFKNMIDDEKLAQFMYKILTLDENYKEGNVSAESIKLDEVVNKMLHESSDVNISNFIDKVLGEDTAKIIFDKLSTEKVDEIVGKILGEDTKQLITAKLETEDLDALLNKLVDEKLSMEDGYDAPHPTFDEFIDKVLGKEVEVFLRKKVRSLVGKTEEKKAGMSYRSK